MTAILALAALAPWLALIPFGGAYPIAGHAIVLVAAFHGAGQVLAWLVKREVHPLLAIQWGIACLVAISGLAMAAHIDGLATQAVIVYGFAAIHTSVIVIDFARLRRGLDARGSTWRIWLVPAVALTAIGLLHVLGAAGDVGAHPFDDDGHVLGQLERLRQTGTLGDAIGYPRDAQLGGQLALGALATLGGEVHLVRMLEALAFVLALALACGRLPSPAMTAAASPRIDDPSTGIWALLLVVAGAALAFVPADPATCWTAIGLVIALHAMLAGKRPALMPIGVTAGALIALRFELAPIAVVAVAAAWWPDRTRKRAAILAGMVAAVVVPYVVVRFAAWHAVPGAARELIAPAHGSLAVRLAVFAGVAIACAPIVIVTWRDHALRWLGIAAAATIAGIASQLTGDRPYAGRFLWPLAIAGGLILIIELARSRKLGTGALLASLVICVLIQEGRDATGRLRWKRRYLDYTVNLEYLRHAAERTPIVGGYDALLRRIPIGATVAVWVARPGRLDYGSGLRIIDLRTPRGARLRVHRWEAHASRVERLLAAARADYLLIELDDKRLERAGEGGFERFACTWDLPICADDLEVVMQHHPVIAEERQLRLIDLRPAPGEDPRGHDVR